MCIADMAAGRRMSAKQTQVTGVATLVALGGNPRRMRVAVTNTGDGSILCASSRPTTEGCFAIFPNVTNGVTPILRVEEYGQLLMGEVYVGPLFGGAVTYVVTELVADYALDTAIQSEV